jgi:PEP-CTERM motif
MKLRVYSFVLAIIVSVATAAHPVYAVTCTTSPALVVARDIPEPSSVLLLAAGLISLALFTTIGRPPFRLKF